MTPDTTQLEHWLTHYGSDLALQSMFRHQKADLIRLFHDLFPPEREVILTACPAGADRSALQVTIFDNHLQTPRGVRWGLNVKAWTSAKIDFRKAPSWNANAKLQDADAALKAAEKLRKPTLRYPIKADTFALLSTLVDVRGRAGKFGLLCHKAPGDGTRYFEEHLVWAEIDDATGEIGRVEIVAPDNMIRLPDFSRRDAAGNRLAGNAIAQARSSALSEFGDWVTGEIGEFGAGF